MVKRGIEVFTQRSGRGWVVSVLIPPKSTVLFCKLFEKNENKQKETGDGRKFLKTFARNSKLKQGKLAVKASHIEIY